MERQIINVDDLRITTRKGSSDWLAVKEIFKEKIYQKPKLGFILEKTDRWVDLGANIGAFSLWASRKVQSVSAFEMNYDNYKITKENLQLNKIQNVQVSNLAIVPNSFQSQNKVYFKKIDPKRYWMHSIFEKEKGTEKTTVKAIQFSEILKHRDCIKMDIEGAEIPILTELDHFDGIKKLVFEWSFYYNRDIKVFRSVLQTLKKHFKNVNHCKVEGIGDKWTFHPPATNVYCWN